MAGILDFLREEAEQSQGTSNMLTAIEHSLKRTPHRNNTEWWDKYLPLFILYTVQQDYEKLEQLTTGLEEDLFTLFYSDLHEAFATITSPRSMQRLSSQDERYIKALIKKRKDNVHTHQLRSGAVPGADSVRGAKQSRTEDGRR